MITNNHFIAGEWTPKDRLNKEFSAQSFAAKQPYAEMLDRYKEMARNYARMENAVAVLSDLRTDASYIYYGGFSRMLRTGKCEKKARYLPFGKRKSSNLFILMTWPTNTCKNSAFSILSNASPKETRRLLFDKQTSHEKRYK